MKPSPRAERASLEASPSSLRRHGGPRATSRLPHSPATAAIPSPPSSQAVPRGTFLATPAPLPSRPGVRPPGGAGEERERPREARPPAPGLRAPTQSARPAPRHLFPPGPRGRGSLLAATPLLPAVPPPPSRPSWLPWALPGQTAPRRRRESKSRRRGPGGAGERARPLTRAPGSCPGPSGAVGGRPWAAAPETERGGGRSAGRGRMGGADPTRPPWRRLGRALPLRLGSSPSAPRRLPDGGRPAGGQWGPRGRAGGTAHPPPSCPAWRALRVLRSADCSSPLRAPGSLARSTAHTPAHTHSPTPTLEPRERSRARRGRPTCARRSAAPFGRVPEKCDSFVRQMCTELPACARHGARHRELRDQNGFLKIPALVKLTL